MNSNVLDLEKCKLCPRNCNSDRIHGQTGFCGQTAEFSLARAALHHWEEPCISGTNGSGAVFFCGCNLKCVFCQNDVLSTSQIGQSISTTQLSDIFLSLQEQGAHNINLVTPGHFIPKLIPAIEQAKNHGLTLPIVYNTGSYEKEKSIKALDGLIDIYLPDLKFYSSSLAAKLANAPNYFEYACSAISEMYRQTGCNEFDNDGLMTKGVIIRHLVLPGHIADSRNILNYIYRTYENNVYISIMNQYTPMPATSAMHDLNHTLKPEVYERLIDYCIDLGIENAFIQEGPTCSESFIPLWDYSGLPKYFM